MPSKDERDDQRRATMKENQPTAALHREEIAKTRRKLADYDERGVAALNPYDQTLGKTMPGGPDAVLELSRTLLTNHLRFYEKQLAPLESTVKQLVLFDLKQ
jgi:hypothetical protein